MASLTSGIKGLVPLSMIDWVGRIVCVVFIGGCNLRCPFCHNRELVLNYKELPDISWVEIEKHLIAKNDWLDGICISGGEPTINKNLRDILVKFKKYKYKVKLDTNGTKPDIIKEIIELKLIDAVAVDIKTTFEKYTEVTRSKVDFVDSIKKSIGEVIRAENKDKVEVYFRTTVVPGIVDKQDVLKIAEFIARKGGRRYILQQYQPKNLIEKRYEEILPYPKEVLEELAEKCSKFVKTIVAN